MQVPGIERGLAVLGNADPVGRDLQDAGCLDEWCLQAFLH
jgi:hypothetical protein